jgi:uncharacterized protein YvpB
MKELKGRWKAKTPKFWKKKSSSYHAVLITGYSEQGIEIMNSWGEDWLDKGFSVIRWKYWKNCSYWFI